MFSQAELEGPEAIEEMAFRLASRELWTYRHRGKRQRWKQLAESTKESWRKAARAEVKALLKVVSKVQRETNECST